MLTGCVPVRSLTIEADESGERREQTAFPVVPFQVAAREADMIEH
jgi:hypothetical protein